MHIKVVSEWFSATRIKTLFIGYTILLFLLAILPINSSGSAINHTFVVSIRLDYLLHCVVFIPWMLLLWKWTGVNFRISLGRSVLFILLSLLFAMCNEGVQYFLPYRAFNINDLLANGLGVLIGAVVFISKQNQIYC
ncbi:MAG: VanZ family protein [Bacteroidales bacterium]|nr:VanZ family protein [Bacteroidales bacterium]MCF8402561.1 VanZ family protein [Bacteroidales bacterium]